jgi:hypothetical protein
MKPSQEFMDLPFEWHCKKGSTETVKQLNDEFNLFRSLFPLKVSSEFIQHQERLFIQSSLPQAMVFPIWSSTI